MTSHDLKVLIEREAEIRGISVATFCKLAAGNHRLHRTLKSGGSCTLDVAERVVKFIGDNPSAISLVDQDAPPPTHKDGTAA